MAEKLKTKWESAGQNRLRGRMGVTWPKSVEKLNRSQMAEIGQGDNGSRLVGAAEYTHTHTHIIVRVTCRYILSLRVSV